MKRVALRLTAVLATFLITCSARSQGVAGLSGTIFDRWADGTVDGLFAPALNIGELDFSSGDYYGDNSLSRGALLFGLPVIARGLEVRAALLRVHLQNVINPSAHPSFGPLQLYHSQTQNVFNGDLIYSGTDFTRVGTVVTPNSAVGQYYFVDVTPQVLSDYAAEGTNAHSLFRLQVDGLQFVEDNLPHYYEIASGYYPTFALEMYIVRQEILHYTLGPGSTITLYQNGRPIGPSERLTGSFGWQGSQDSQITYVYDATQLEFRSPSVSIRLNTTSNDYGSSLFLNTNQTAFGEIVDANISNSPPVIGVQLSQSGAEWGTYFGPPERPAKLVYPAVVLRSTRPLAVLSLVAYAGGDSDADGIPDAIDECPDTRAGVVVNDHGCSLEQLVRCDSPWRNHGEYLSALRDTADNFLVEGRITATEHDAILQAGAISDCGKKSNSRTRR